MRAPRLALLLATSVLLAGCTFGGRGGDDENVDAPDLTSYAGGTGFALLVNNNGTDPFFVTIRVLGAGNADMGTLSERVEPGRSVEKWWSLERRDTYSARMNYTWTAAAGASSQGTDEQVFDANDCPEVTRLAWDLRQTGNTVGHAFTGRSCVVAGDED